MFTLGLLPSFFRFRSSYRFAGDSFGFPASHNTCPLARVHLAMERHSSRFGVRTTIRFARHPCHWQNLPRRQQQVAGLKHRTQAAELRRSTSSSLLRPGLVTTLNLRVFGVRSCELTRMLNCDTCSDQSIMTLKLKVC